ncbi:hypothetical protein F4818DRAFT_402141 [Hypoxylon cercidicola]|nr:hypothetical protein F4818DRAFT_402141 [Hypoxylon cercidicola]
MDRKRGQRVQLKIPVSFKPRPYRPGDGPPLAPLTLVPENDSNAFITDKRVLPSTTANGEPKLLMYYLVGWSDLPAARVAILATEVYDYVSQRTVEDFEYRASLERDEEEQWKEAEKRRRAKVAAAKKAKSINATNATTTPTTPGTPTVPGQKRRGRPSKAMLQARRLAVRAILNSPTDIEVPLPPAGTSGPSLSTPQKKRTTELAIDMDEDEADADNAIYRQLCGDNSEVDHMDVDNNEESDDLLPDSIPEVMSTSTSAEIRTYAQNLWPNKDSTLFKHVNGKLAVKSSTSYVPVPEVLRSNKQFPPKPLPPKAISGRISTTPIPVPPPSQLDTRISPSKPLDGKHSNIPIPPPAPLGSNNEIPHSKSFDGKHSTTPIPVPSWPRSMNGTYEPPASAPPVSRTMLIPNHGFTPAARSSGRWPLTSSQSPGNTAAADGPESPLNKLQNHKEREGSSRPEKKPKTHHIPKEAEEKQQVWVVDRLEGDRIVETEDGGHERYFKVRWEGEWPADQNPTWEPEDNIPPHLVKRYLKKKKKSTRSHDSPAKNGGTPSKAPPKRLLKRKYSSVMEAFEGDDEVIHNLGEDLMNEEESDGQEEILVVATESKKSPKPRPEELSAKFLRDLTAAINNNGDKRDQL